MPAGSVPAPLSSVPTSAIRTGGSTTSPNHPLADANGMVRRPDIDLSDQMVYMQLAQRGYQANVQAFERAREAYESILSIGK